MVLLPGHPAATALLITLTLQNTYRLLLAMGPMDSALLVVVGRSIWPAGSRIVCYKVEVRSTVPTSGGTLTETHRRGRMTGIQHIGFASSQDGGRVVAQTVVRRQLRA